MIRLSENGAYYIKGEIIEDTAENAAVIAGETGGMTPERGSSMTMAYGILDSHNTSGNMENLKVKFDKIISHDITYVGT